MHHTQSLLWIYVFPAVVLSGLLAAALGMPLPWIIACLVLPVLGVGAYLVAGAIADSRNLDSVRPSAPSAPAVAEETLCRDLVSLDAKARLKAALALCETRGAASVEPLGRALRQDPLPEVRYNAARALGLRDDPRCVEPLCAGLRDPDVTVRRSAALSLAWVGDERAFASLQRAWVDDDTQVRFWVNQALLRINPALADPALVCVVDGAETAPWADLLALAVVRDVRPLIRETQGPWKKHSGEAVEHEFGIGHN